MVFRWDGGRMYVDFKAGVYISNHGWNAIEKIAD